MPDTKSDSDTVAPLSELLLTHAKGSTDAEAGELLRQVVAAVAETEKNGTLMVKFTVKPVDNSDGAVAITAEVTAKAPQHPPAASIWYAAEDGALSRHHPSQMSFPDFPPRD